MKKPLSIHVMRRIATGVTIAIVLIFVVFTTYLWIAYRNVLRDTVIVSADKQLLTKFDTSKFDRAVDRLEKRRNLESPAEDIRDPFGAVAR